MNVQAIKDSIRCISTLIGIYEREWSIKKMEYLWERLIALYTSRNILQEILIETLSTTEGE